MGTNFNPTGLKTFAEMGFQPKFNISAPQSFPAQSPIAQAPMQMQTPGQASMIQPAAQNAYPQNVNTAQNVSNVNLEKTPKQDTVTIAGKEMKKKNVVIAGLTIAAAAVAAGALIFRGRQSEIPLPDDIKTVHGAAKSLMQRAQNIIESANLFKAEGSELAQKANGLAEELQKMAQNVHEKINSVMNLVAMADSDVKDTGAIRKIIHDTNTNMDIMEEYAQDGITLIRKSCFNSDKSLESIVEFLPDGKQNITTFAAKGKISSYEEGLQQITEGTKTDKILLFENGMVFKYKQGVETSSTGEKAAVILDLSAGKPKTYMEGYEKINGEKTIEKIKRALDFKEGVLKKYKKDVEIEDESIYRIKKKFNFEKHKYQENYEGNFIERTETRGRSIFFKDKGVSRYEEGVVCEDDKPVSIQRMLVFDGGNPERYYETVQISDTGAKSAKKGIRYRDEQPSTYMEDFEVIEGRVTDFKRKVTNQSGAWTESNQASSAA